MGIFLIRREGKAYWFSFFGGVGLAVVVTLLLHSSNARYYFQASFPNTLRAAPHDETSVKHEESSFLLNRTAMMLKSTSEKEYLEGEYDCLIPNERTRYIPPSVIETNRTWDFGKLKFKMLKNNITNYDGAFVTMVSTNNTNYLISTLVMRETMRMQNSTWPFVLLAGMNHVPSSLMDAFDMVIRVPKIPSVADAHLWLKLHMLALVKFERVTWIGGDIVVLKNIDEIMHCPPPCSVGDYTLSNLNYLGLVVNGDLFVVRPSMEDYENVLAMCKYSGKNRKYFMMNCNAKKTKQCACFNTGQKGWRVVNTDVLLGPNDQGILNKYYQRYLTVLPRHYLFDARLGVGITDKKSKYYDGYIVSKFETLNQDTKAIHFVGNSKPWEEKPSFLKLKSHYCSVANVVAGRVTNEKLAYCT